MDTQCFIRPCNVDCGPAMATVAAAIADVTRSRMLWMLLEGRGMSAGELAIAALTSPQNASNHLSALLAAGLVRVHRQGRHRYYLLADALVAQAIESLLAITKTDVVPCVACHSARLEPWRFARSCYDHLAGKLAIEVRNSLIAREILMSANGAYELGPHGEVWLQRLGIDVQGLRSQRRALARECMDWTERQPHIGGALGAALLSRMLELHWLKRTKIARQLALSSEGERQLKRLLGIDSSTVRSREPG